jgi:Nucleoside-diphosphate-sugar epimerases
MRVLVTGTAGRVGSVTAQEFLDHGYQVRALDLAPPRGDLRSREGLETVYADLRDRLAILKAVEGCDAIAHLAAVPHPGPADDRILAVNVLGTHHILDAAEAFGIKRVAIASTCCTYGIYFALHPFDPEYLPLDEKHPVKPQDLYALSKVLVEEEAAAYTRRSGMTTVCLRLTSVMDFSGPHRRWWRNNLTSDVDRRNDLWTYIEMRDAARAFRLAVENAPEGTSANLIIANRDSFTTHDIRHLIRKHFPALAPQVEHLAPKDSVYDTRRAEEHMGFVAQNSWRDHPEFADLVADAAGTARA